MSYKVYFTKQFEKSFKKLDRYTMKMIKAWIEKNIQNCENPRLHGKALSHNLRGLWRYRIGDYRLICEIRDDELIILALKVSHRKDIYE